MKYKKKFGFYNEIGGVFTDTDKAKLAEEVIKLKAGDKSAFDSIYKMTSQNAYFTALKITKNEDDAQDILQESYISVLQKIDALEKPESFMSWFNMIVANNARSLLRKNNPLLFRDEETQNYYVDAARQGETDESEYVPGVVTEKKELIEEVNRLVDSLSDEKRTVVILYFFNKMTTKQIAVSLGINENTVKSRIVQAKKDIEKGVHELESKNKKLLGVAPIPLVIWALKSSSATAYAAFATSGAAASVIAAVTSYFGISSAAAASAAVTAGATAAAAMKATPASGTALEAGKGIARFTLTQKIIAASVAAIITIGGVTTGVIVAKKAKEDKVSTSTLPVTTRKELVTTESETIETETETESETETAAEPDFDRLIEVFPGCYPEKDYNCKSSNASDYAFELLLKQFGSIYEYFDERQITKLQKNQVPHDDVPDAEYYYRYPADEVDNILRQVFNVEPSHKAEYRYIYSNIKYAYYENSYYYVGIFVGGMEGQRFKLRDYNKGDDNVYTIKIEELEFDDHICYYTIKAKPIMLNGKSDWSFFTIKSDIQSESETYNIPAENTWQYAYSEFLRSRINNGNENERFGLAYIDNDDTPELVVSHDFVHHTYANIFAFKNNKVVEVGEFYAAGGELGYYERKGIIFEEESGMGNYDLRYYKYSDGSYQKLDSLHSWLPTLMQEDYEYEVNGKPSNEEEFNRIKTSYDNKYGTASYSGREFEITESSIAANCR